MKAGVSTASFFPLETEFTLDELHKMGVKDIEVFLEAESETTPDFCKLLKDKIKAYGMNVVSVHAFCAAFEPFLFSEYKRRSGDALNTFIKYCKAMEYLDAEYYTFHGTRNDPLKAGFSYREYCMVFSSLASIARECGGLLSWENVSWCHSGNSEFLKNCMQYLDKKVFGFTFDFKQALRAGNLPEIYLDIMKDNLVNVHISDYDDFSPCTLPGTGKRDFFQVISMLDGYKYDGALLIEVYNDCYRNYGQIGKSYEFIKGLITDYEDQNTKNTRI